MGEAIRLTARDGHELDAYRAEPAGDPIGGVVVVQEVFGLTPQIERVADRFAEAGFRAIAPALFDRVGRGLVVDYGELEKGREIMRQLEWPNTLADVSAAVDAMAGTPCAVVGFCWGGTVAYMAAAHVPIHAAVSYYGSAIASLTEHTPKCPVLYHFGADDSSIPPDAIERIRQAHPDGIFHVYPNAGHAFANEDRPSFRKDAAELSFERTLAFLRERLAARDPRGT